MSINILLVLDCTCATESWIVVAGVLASLLIISWSIFIATCVVVLCKRTISSETSSNVKTLKRKALYSLHICTYIYESVSIIYMSSNCNLLYINLISWFIVV